MKKMHLFIIICLVSFLGVGSIFAQEEKIHKTFTGIREVQIKTTSGDCEIKQGTTAETIVDVVYSVQPGDSFEPDIQERAGVLKLRERWYGSSSGRVNWTLTVPAETDIDFSTASGELFINGLDNKIEASAASGDITVEECKGDFDISTASGDISLRGVSGNFDWRN